MSLGLIESLYWVVLGWTVLGFWARAQQNLAFVGINILTFLESRDNLEEEEERLETERFKEDDLDLCCSSS